MSWYKASTFCNWRKVRGERGGINFLGAVIGGKGRGVGKEVSTGGVWRWKTLCQKSGDSSLWRFLGYHFSTRWEWSVGREVIAFKTMLLRLEKSLSTWAGEEGDHWLGVVEPLTKLFILLAPPRAASTALGLKKLPMMLWRVRSGGLASCWVIANKISKFRIFSFFFKRRKTKRKIDMAIGVKLLEFGDSCKDFRSKLRVKISFPCQESIPFFPKKFGKKLLKGNVRIKVGAIGMAGCTKGFPRAKIRNVIKQVLGMIRKRRLNNIPFGSVVSWPEPRGKRYRNKFVGIISGDLYSRRPARSKRRGRAVREHGKIRRREEVTSSCDWAQAGAVKVMAACGRNAKKSMNVFFHMWKHGTCIFNQYDCAAPKFCLREKVNNSPNTVNMDTSITSKT